MRELKESAIQRQILDGLKAAGIFCFRLNTGGFGGSHKGKKWFVRPHSLGAGCADILAIPHLNEGELCNEPDCWCARFQPIWIECKKDGGTQSPAQKEFERYVTGLGHRYIIARDWTEVEHTLR